jgi:hypothetical protein
MLLIDYIAVIIVQRPHRTFLVLHRHWQPMHRSFLIDYRSVFAMSLKHLQPLLSALSRIPFDSAASKPLTLYLQLIQLLLTANKPLATDPMFAVSEIAQKLFAK